MITLKEICRRHNICYSTMMYFLSHNEKAEQLLDMMVLKTYSNSGKTLKMVQEEDESNFIKLYNKLKFDSKNKSKVKDTQLSMTVQECLRYVDCNNRCSSYKYCYQFISEGLRPPVKDIADKYRGKI